MAHPLDDLSFVKRLDPKDMLGLTERFPAQCREALAIARAADLPPLSNPPTLAMLTGLGGSAAGGDFVRALFEAQGSCPFQVNRDYSLPSFAGPGTLLFAVSYSGNTEETLAAYADAKKKGCPIIAVTSGGKLAELAAADGYPLIRVPGGQPPRTALGYLLIPVVAACEALGLLPAQPFEEAFAALDEGVRAWGAEVPYDQNPTKQLAQSLFGKVSVLYGLGGWQGVVAGRWKAQINENSKNHTFAHAFPELNHNEILGWVACGKQNAKHWAIVLLHDGTESAKLKARARITFEMIGDRAQVFEARALGQSLLARMLSLTFFGDWTSIYLAALNEVDPENIDWLNHLKGELANIP
ncbi:MAG TPA: bifunctional phosphoglucose/phosphomannose isomerase [Fimbriimonadaceae bacterium]|nr:bifunctional phosphoglucose/phosphomannose isomerase [Fimbriimonadaceae bacterium]